MAERNWTDAQRRAIDYRGKDLILSAAAGSGKTATLTQRIIELIKDPCCGARLERMLVVTFTKAAAGELRERISDALNNAIAEDPSSDHIMRQISALERAKISTIHSFLKAELTPYATELGLPPEFTVLDEAEAAVMRSDAMRETVDSFFEAGDSISADFESLCDCISGAREEGGADDVLLALRDSLASEDVDKKQIYAIAEELERNCGDVCQTSYYDAVKDQMREGGNYYAEVFREIGGELSACEDTEAYTEQAELCRGIALSLADAADGSYSQTEAKLSDFSLGKLAGLSKLKQTDAYVRFKDTRAGLTAFIRKLKNDFFNETSDRMSVIAKETAKKMRLISTVVEKFEEIYSLKKRERGAVDYTDLERFAKKIFCTDSGEPSAAAKEVGKKFDYVFIDEYQDTNAVQDAVFSAVSAECGRFMVGDVKQSIYSFRGARPQIFTDYRLKYADCNDGEAVFMSDNFRSSAGVIDFSNLVSGYIFSTGATPFEKEDRLVCRKGGAAEKCEICIVQKDDGGRGKNTEAEYVAQRIKAMIADGKNEKGEPLCPRDFAILLRSAKAADEYVQALNEAGVPAVNSAAEEFFSYKEVLLVLCLINSVDNPLRDTYLAGAMKSPVCGFSLTDLVKLRGADRDPLWYSVCRYAAEGSDRELAEKCSAFAEQLNRWRNAAKELPADEMLRLIISDTRLLNYCGDETRSRSDISRSVRSLITHACTVARRGGGLHETVIYFNSLIEQKDKSVSGGSDCVSVLTIHRSKGLEYPVCFISDCSREFNLRDSYGKVILGRNGELAMKLYDDEGIVRYDTPLRRALGLGLVRRSIEEEARILYVAMTRAAQRLIVTLSSDDADADMLKSAENARLPLTPYMINSSRSYAEWILDTAARYPADGSFTLIRAKAGEIAPSSTYANAENTVTDENICKFLSGPLDISYEREYLRNIPAKLTVSKLKPDILDGGEDERMTVDGRYTFSMPEKMSLPEFMQKQEPTAADAGIATHMFMQFCDWKSLYKNGADAELGRLEEKGFLRAEDAAAVRVDEIELFCRSKLFKRLLGAKSVVRERRFNASLPAENFTTDEQLAAKLGRDGINITVQGVVDCIFCDCDGKWVLADYKTDRLTSAQLDDRASGEKLLRERHSRQLSLYRDICEKLLGITFDEVCIYSLPMGDTVSIERAQPALI